MNRHLSCGYLLPPYLLYWILHRVLSTSQRVDLIRPKPRLNSNSDIRFRYLPVSIIGKNVTALFKWSECFSPSFSAAAGRKDKMAVLWPMLLHSPISATGFATIIATIGYGESSLRCSGSSEDTVQFYQWTFIHLSSVFLDEYRLDGTHCYLLSCSRFRPRPRFNWGLEGLLCTATFSPSSVPNYPQ